MAWTDTFLDLLACCASAPALPHRRVAEVLLARELHTALECGTRDYRRAPNEQRHPAYLTIAELSLQGDDDSLAAWAARQPLERGGPTTTLGKLARQAGWGGASDAEFYYVCGRHEHARHKFPCATTLRVPAPSSVHVAARAEVETLGGELKTLAVAAMGAPAFAAARQVWVDRLAADAALEAVVYYE